ncbi:MAG: hypothetical protein IJW67_05860, partial [Blautia sp.]|nr:hypothetical protein [Blautia sp.]
MYSIPFRIRTFIIIHHGPAKYKRKMTCSRTSAGWGLVMKGKKCYNVAPKKYAEVLFKGVFRMKKKLFEFARSVFRFFVVIKKDMEGKEYRIRHTPFAIRVPYQKISDKKWGSLPIVKNRIV